MTAAEAVLQWCDDNGFSTFVRDSVFRGYLHVGRVTFRFENDMMVSYTTVVWTNLDHYSHVRTCLGSVADPNFFDKFKDALTKEGVSPVDKQR